ncbi:MAG: hypothetical protein BJ554DRAFT_431, partial [Olpidium bornovanus]
PTITGLFPTDFHSFGRAVSAFVLGDVPLRVHDAPFDRAELAQVRFHGSGRTGRCQPGGFPFAGGLAPDGTRRAGRAAAGRCGTGGRSRAGGPPGGERGRGVRRRGRRRPGGKTAGAGHRPRFAAGPDLPEPAPAGAGAAPAVRFRGGDPVGRRRFHARDPPHTGPGAAAAAQLGAPQRPALPADRHHAPGGGRPGPGARPGEVVVPAAGGQAGRRPGRSDQQRGGRRPPAGPREIQAAQAQIALDPRRGGFRRDAGPRGRHPLETQGHDHQRPGFEVPRQSRGRRARHAAAAGRSFRAPSAGAGAVRPDLPRAAGGPRPVRLLHLPGGRQRRQRRPAVHPLRAAHREARPRPRVRAVLQGPEKVRRVLERRPLRGVFPARTRRDAAAAPPRPRRGPGGGRKARPDSLLRVQGTNLEGDDSERPEGELDEPSRAKKQRGRGVRIPSALPEPSAYNAAKYIPCSDAGPNARHTDGSNPYGVRIFHASGRPFTCPEHVWQPAAAGPA